jgi:uncharacterized membrane protein YjjP (DUF1212 family)
MSIIVKTADELKTAIQNKEVDIHVTGDLADAIISQKKKRKIAKIGVGVGLAALALAPFTGGGSVAGFAAATAARTGLVMGATAAATGAAGVTAGPPRRCRGMAMPRQRPILGLRGCLKTVA